MIGFSLRRTVVTGLAALSLSAVFVAPVVAQNAVIRGTVTSSDRKEAISGVNIVITELNISVLSSDRGAYVITIPAARIPAQPVNVTARAIGFKAVIKGTLIRAGEQTVDFVLQTDVNRLEEVVVTGVMEGTERQKVPFAVGRLTAEDIPVPAMDPLRALQGKVAGVRIAQTSGKPGSTPEILLRGPTSINGSGRSQEPLIIVDDAIMNVGSLEELGGLDIESVEVVKGAAGASLYGTRAANGVITIRTKRGLTGGEGVKFNVRTEFGTSDFNSIHYGIPLNHPLQLDETGKRFCVATSGFPCNRTVDWMTEFARINNKDGPNNNAQQNIVYNTPSAADLRNVFQAQIWPGQYYNTMAQIMTHNPTYLTALDATGRVGNVGFYVSGSFQDEAGAVRGFGGVTQKRARVNLDYNARSDLKISISTVYDDLYNDVRTIDFGTILRGAPPGTNYLARDTVGCAHDQIATTGAPISTGNCGRFFNRAGGTGFRPTGNGGFGIMYDSENWTSDRNSKRFLGSMTGKYFPADWVTFEGTFAYDNRTRKDIDYIPRGYKTASASSTTNGGNIAFSDLITESYNSSLTATFRRKLTSDLNGKLSFRGLFDQTNQVANGTGRRAIYLVKDIYQLGNTTTVTSNPSSSSLTIKNTGLFAGVTADYKDRYIVEGSVRYDGSSLFGSGHRWSPFGRLSGVWIVSKEPFYHLGFMDELRFRASRGTAGTTPSFAAQYETYSVSTTGITLGQIGNANLRPETTTELELGTDFTLFHKLGIEFTYAHGKTKDQILPVTTIAALGFTTQWQNAGTLTNSTLELAANLPIVNSKSFYWNMRGSWDRTRTYISELFVPDFVANGGTGQGTGSFFYMTADKRRACLPGEEGHLPGEAGFDAGQARPHCTGPQLNRYGNIYARHFLKSCNELAASIRSDCGEGKSYQVNDEGWLVWVGAGNSYKDGITKNLWQTVLPESQSPWGVPISWGHPIVDRPLAGQPGQGVGIQTVEGNSLPSFRFTFSNDIQYKKLTLYALVDATVGHKINNQGEGWGLLDLSSDHFDQKGKSVELAKPVGYSWRAGSPESTGTGGFYDVLNVNNYTLESGSFAKLREVNLTYKVGRVAGVGDWTVGLVGRNLFTITGYSGYDPETGAGSGVTGSGLINQTDAFGYPTLRTFTFSLSTRF